ncbi:LSU ribosomal protein L2P [Methanocorpusculum labreanum Z]|uniref:Large ribosomal subunit protein uL2 n=1 Tax=Methanocorpusculum labreanum (strain ATCC 43576 / DSM 4855 / Z) TaxID=410358 RepID=RL2_METLZ|nr:50S ribosomal protein L2 [Methanocorpusculum labreanum]A2SPK6.1 RecName: Full=Large ribosomal subunit protein uL2; AltName: Full=50S ribosomal protein L2 [Methanocorpusculum labreanum Z]ABN06262.1 LSU ribosomal protein L2P [Methanocorpusculum labreanum Z]
MGHRISTQSRGKGGPTYRAPSHQYKAELKHFGSALETVRATVIDIEHDPARHTPIAVVKIEGKASDKKEYALITEGVGIGQELVWGPEATVVNGNSLPLSAIPTGVAVCNIEARPGDGGKFVRSSGVQAVIIGKSAGKVGVRMPSGKPKWFNEACLATVGLVAGGGRIDKPILKAGKQYHKMKTSATRWPRVRGVAMNVIDHPFGGGGHQHPGKPKTVARGASPGRKVGSVAARRTGYRR